MGHPARNAEAPIVASVRIARSRSQKLARVEPL
jgi:hypothetical protein